ncbi:MAG: hypothetical protein KC431_30680 [Myxococcales bacterium]|nr:hypothetical protein [Myxococcales bacterium]
MTRKRDPSIATIATHETVGLDTATQADAALHDTVLRTEDGDLGEHADEDARVLERIDRYIVLRQLGEGGMGRVY